MTAAPDPAETVDLAAPRDLAEDSPRRRGLGLAFWAMIGFGFICILAGLAFSRFAPVLFPVKTPAASAPAAAATPPETPAATAQPAPPPPLAPTPALAPQPAQAQVLVLSGRVDRLEADQRRAAHAAAEALAAAELSEASASSLPFANQLAGIDRLLPDSADLRDLRLLAATGAPSRAALAVELAGLADRAAVAARAPEPNSGLAAHITHALAAVFTLRRVDKLTGSSPDAILARAQQRANDADIEGALKAVDALPKGGQTALAEWRAHAERRVAIDRHVAALRGQALRDLTPLAQAGAGA